MITAIDHVALTTPDLDATCGFYERLFGAVVVVDHVVGGVSLVKQITLGGALLSIHQQGNGIDLVAAHPVPGSVDICFRWGGTIHSAIDHLEANGVRVIEGPAPRRTALGVPSHSVYFRDPDDNLLELMAED